MFKRGQVTLFAIAGIVIIIAIALVVILRGSVLKASSQQAISKTLSFSESVDEVKHVVDICLEESLKKGIVQLGNRKTEDYEAELAQVVQSELYRCSDFSQLSVDVVRKTPSVAISLSEDRSKVIADANFELVVKKGNDVERLNSFSKELHLFSDCCIPVEVDSQCRAKASGEFRVCVSLYNIHDGDNLNIGGECLAC